MSKGAAALSVLLVAFLSAAFVACNGDDDEGDGPASLTPFIAPSPFTTAEALQKLSEAEVLIKVPDPELVNTLGISTTDLEQRIALALQGTSDTTGLDNAKAALREENRILAAEYIYNVVIDYLTPAFGSEDADSIDEEQLNEIDPGRIFVEDHSQGMFTTAVFKEAVIKLIELWYRVLPGNSAPAGT